MASAMPVLPLVASMSVAPGSIAPRFSAPMTMASAGRSFTEPAGLLPSILASKVLLDGPGMRCRRTSGVLPTNCSRLGYIEKAPRSAGLRFERSSILLLLFVVFLLLLVGFLLGVGLGVRLGIGLGVGCLLLRRGL